MTRAGHGAEGAHDDFVTSLHDVRSDGRQLLLAKFRATGGELVLDYESDPSNPRAVAVWWVKRDARGAAVARANMGHLDKKEGLGDIAYDLLRQGKDLRVTCVEVVGGGANNYYYGMRIRISIPGESAYLLFNSGPKKPKRGPGRPPREDVFTTRLWD